MRCFENEKNLDRNLNCVRASSPSQRLHERENDDMSMKRVVRNRFMAGRGKEPEGLCYSTSIPSSLTVNRLPLKSLTSRNNEDNLSISLPAIGGCMRNIIMPENCFGGNKTESRKSLSLLTNTYFFFNAKDASSLLTVPFGAYSDMYSFPSRNFLSSFGMFSSENDFSNHSGCRVPSDYIGNTSSRRNFGVVDMVLSGYKSSCPFQGILYHGFIQGRVVILNDFFWCYAGAYKFDYIADKDSCAPESGLAVADFAVRDYMLADFDSHSLISRTELFKLAAGGGLRAIRAEAFRK